MHGPIDSSFVDSLWLSVGLDLFLLWAFLRVTVNLTYMYVQRTRVPVVDRGPPVEDLVSLTGDDRIASY
jgi:hypothetical protein